MSIKFTMRLAESLCNQLTQEAKRQGVSRSQWISVLLQQFLDRESFTRISRRGKKDIEPNEEILNLEKQNLRLKDQLLAIKTKGQALFQVHYQTGRPISSAELLELIELSYPQRKEDARTNNKKRRTLSVGAKRITKSHHNGAGSIRDGAPISSR